MKRAFHITIAGSKSAGAPIVSSYVWATNCEQLFFHLQQTFLCNKNVEVYDVDKNKVYTKQEFVFSVCRKQLSTSAFFRSELDFIGFDDQKSEILDNQGFVEAFKKNNSKKMN